MPRAIWTGTISFGLVNVPVRMYAAVAHKNVRFNQLDARTGNRIRLKKVSALTGEDVASDDIVRGYEVSPDNYVVITDDELAALDPDASRTIDLYEFVDLGTIDPVYFDRPYYLAPDPAFAKPYALLTEVMTRVNRAGIGNFVMRNRLQLAAIRPVKRHLVLSTLMYGDEVKDPADLEEFDALADLDLPEREVKLGEQLVRSLSTEFEAERYRDSYRELVLDLIQRKADGMEVFTETASPPQRPVVDLMAALEESVEQAKKARGGASEAAGDEQRSA